MYLRYLEQCLTHCEPPDQSNFRALLSARCGHGTITPLTMRRAFSYVCWTNNCISVCRWTEGRRNVIIFGRMLFGRLSCSTPQSAVASSALPEAMQDLQTPAQNNRTGLGCKRPRKIRPTYYPVSTLSLFRRF